MKAIMMPHAGEREDAQAARRLYLDKGEWLCSPGRSGGGQLLSGACLPLHAARGLVDRMPATCSAGSVEGRWAGACTLCLLQWPLPACTGEHALPFLCCRGHRRGSQRHAPVPPGREGSPAGGPAVRCACCTKFLDLVFPGREGSCGPERPVETACGKPVPPSSTTTSVLPDLRSHL